MRFIKKTASIISSLIIILAIGGYIFVKNFDLNRYKTYIQDIVYEQTGRLLEIKGDAKLGISLVPTIDINNVSFSNPSWAKNENMIRLEKLEIKFAILPLLNKKIEINKLVLVRPEIYLEKSIDGDNSWDFVSKGEQKDRKVEIAETEKVKKATSVLAIGLIAEKVEIKNGIVTYYDAKTQQVKQVDLKNLTLDIKGEDKPIKLEMDAFLDGQEFDIEAEVSTLSSLLDDAKVSFIAKANIMNIDMNFFGSVEDVMESPRYAIEGNVYSPAGNFGIAEISAEIRVDGDIKSADVTLNNLNVANNELTGAIKVDWSKQKPEIKANINSQLFDINSLGSGSMLSFRMPELISSAQALQIVPNDVIPYQYLMLFNGVLDIKISKLILSEDMIVNDVVLSAIVKDDVLDVSKFSIKIGNSNLDAIVNVNAKSEKILLKVMGDNIKVQDLYAPLVAGNNGGLQIIEGGKVVVDADLSMNGKTFRKLSETISGQIIAIMDKSEIKTGKLKWLTEGFFSKVFSLLGINTTKSTDMDVACAVVRTDIKNGVANFPSGIVFDGSKLKLVSSGTINMVNDEINLTIAPTLNKLADGNITQALASFVRIAGTLSHPKLKLDKTATLTTVLGTIVSGGTYLGAEAMLSGDDTPCYAALVGTKYVSRFPKPKGIKAGTKNVYQDITKQAKSMVKDVGGVAKDFFGVLKNNLEKD